MLELIILWAYMAVLNTCIGMGVLHLVYKLTGRKTKAPEIMDSLLAGVVTIIAYAQAFSIFGKVGALAHLLMLLAGVVSVIACRSTFLNMIKKWKKVLFSWEGAVYLLFVIMTAYCASRGIQHTDTGIYHAQAIRWYEEYGLVKGLGNLQLHHAYNSASLAYAAIFSMKWLVGQSLHPTSGFLQAVLCVWALYGLKDFFKHENHAADGCRLAILLHALVYAESIMSPATDHTTMLLALWVMTRWAQIACEETYPEKTDRYALLCVAIVCITTCKLSAGLMVILVIYPAVYLLKGKEWKKIGVYLTLGILCLIPFLVRNYLISGWLIYPFAAVDLFSVDWKIPVNYLEVDSAQIKVYGRNVYDVTKVNDPVSAWFPVWWEAKDRYEKMLLTANLLAVPMGLLAVFYKLLKKKEIRWDLVLLGAAAFACLVGWFLLAPFIRYGLAFLLVFPLLVLGCWLKKMQNGPVRIISGFGCAAIFLSLCMYWDYYVLKDVVWVKQHLTDPCYIKQQDYDQVEVGTIQMDSLTVYYPINSDNMSYHDFPATAYKMFGERCEMRGDSIEDGFRAKG